MEDMDAMQHDENRAPRGYSIPIIDLDARTQGQSVVDREKGQYLGHVTTVLLEDSRTILAVYPKGHGRGAIVYKRSDDAGLTWSGRLPTPKSWETSKEVPVMRRVVDAAGKKRLIMFSGLYPCRMAVSEDDGATWSELEPLGDWGGIVCMGDVIALKKPGHYMAMFHDDGRFLRGGPGGPTGELSAFMTFLVTFSKDGGLTWSDPKTLFRREDVHLCEPGMIRSPDGNEIAVLMRENKRVRNAHVMFSRDEGRTWTEPRELPGALTGDRHTLKYAPDGRLVATFRDTGLESPTWGDWVAWVGTYDDIANGREGQYRIRLKDNKVNGDCCYPGFEVLPGGTFVATTYGHWVEGEEPYILSVRFTLKEIDELAVAQAEPLKIVAFGDSATAPRSTVNFVYADRLPDLLAKRGITATVVDAGVGGSHTGRLADNARHPCAHALERLDAAVRAHKADVVVVQFGINDSWVDSNLPEGPSRIPLADYKRNLTTIVGTLKKDGARVILMTPNKIGLMYEDWRVARLAGYAAAVRQVAREQQVALVDIWQAYEAFEGKVGAKRDELMLDGMHPSDKGHELTASALAECISGKSVAGSGIQED